MSDVQTTQLARYRWLARGVVAFHSAVVVFVLLGVLAVSWQPWLAWPHIFIILFVATIYLVRVKCPLTALENRFRRLGGRAEYDGSFLGHYLGAAVPPLKWERAEPWIGTAVLLGNLALYVFVAGS